MAAHTAIGGYEHRVKLKSLLSSVKPESAGNTDVIKTLTPNVNISDNSFVYKNEPVTPKAGKKAFTAKWSAYYTRVRTYKTVSGKNYYSGWSSVKSVKTK